MKSKDRKACDKLIEKSDPDQKKAWVQALLPADCMKNDGESWSLKKGDGCRKMIKKLNDKEQKAWVVGMLPLQCTDGSLDNKDRLRKKEKDFLKQGKRQCEKLESTLGEEID